MLGECASCGKKIIEIKKERGKTRPVLLPNYYEHFIELSNQTIMRIGICGKCKIDVVSKDAKKIAKNIIDRHIQYWKKDKKNRPDNFETLKCVKPNTTPEDFMRQKEKRKREQQEIKEIIRKIKK